MKWLVYAFYPHLGIPVRVLNFNRKGELLDYVSGLRMTDTPYAIQDVTNKDNPLMVEVEYGDLGKKKIIEMLTEWAERKEDELRIRF